MDQRRNAPRPVVAALIGIEAGAAVGLLFLGETPLAPLVLAAGGGMAGPLVAAGVARIRHQLVVRGIREQLRRGHAPGAAGDS